MQLDNLFHMQHGSNLFYNLNLNLNHNHNYY